MGDWEGEDAVIVTTIICDAWEEQLFVWGKGARDVLQIFVIGLREVFVPWTDIKEDRLRGLSNFT